MCNHQKRFLDADNNCLICANQKLITDLNYHKSKWIEYEQKYILPCWELAKKSGIDLARLVQDKAGTNGVILLIKKLQNMVQVIYFLDDNEVMIAVLDEDTYNNGYGNLLLRVPEKYIGKPDWFAKDYVEANNGIVPDYAKRGNQPGEWMYTLDYVNLLAESIRKHRDFRGDNRCWLNDEELYKILPEGYVPPKRDSCVEIGNCEKFIGTRHNPNTTYISPQDRIDELEKQLKEVKIELLNMREECNQYGMERDLNEA